MNSNNLDVLISDYICSDIGEDDNHFYSSKLAILDTIGCIIEASNHENVLQFASKNNLSLNFKNPFKNISVNESYENISWYLTVLTRWFDYNDTFLAKEWAHPSDNFGSIYSYFYKNKNYKYNDFSKKRFEIAQKIDEIMDTEKNLFPNVDFYGGLLLAELGFEVDLFTPIFVAGRSVGWASHYFEQREQDILIRPAAKYTGHSER